MPCEYRRLSPKEREELIKERIARGYPLHAPPHPFRDAGAYLIFAANFEHQSVMKSDERKTAFELLLLKTLHEIADDLIAWVILPNHYHFLASVQSLNFVSSALKLLHGRTSHQWNIEDGLTGKRRIWYKFVDTYIRNAEHLHLAFNYVHHNPVKHGYVKDPFDWPWSSLITYYNDKGEDWIREHWRSFTPPHDFGKGWDDHVRND